MIKSPFNSDYVTKQEFSEFKEFVGECFDKMEELINNTKVEVIGTLTNVVDVKIYASEQRIIKSMANTEKRLEKKLDKRIYDSENRILEELAKKIEKLDVKIDRIGKKL